MKIGITIVVLAVFAAAMAAHAQTADQLKAQIATLDQQIPSLNDALMQSPEFQELRKAAERASDAYNDALAKNPEISDLDKQLAELRQQTAELIKKRIDKEIELASTALAAEKAAKDEADRKFHEARTESDLGKALDQRRQLDAKLAGAEPVQAAK